MEEEPPPDASFPADAACLAGGLLDDELSGEEEDSLDEEDSPEAPSELAALAVLVLPRLSVL